MSGTTEHEQEQQEDKLTSKELFQVNSNPNLISQFLNIQLQKRVTFFKELSRKIAPQSCSGLDMKNPVAAPKSVEMISAFDKDAKISSLEKECFKQKRLLSKIKKNLENLKEDEYDIIDLVTGQRHRTVTSESYFHLIFK